VIGYKKLFLLHLSNSEINKTQKEKKKIKTLKEDEAMGKIYIRTSHNSHRILLRLLFVLSFSKPCFSKK
jgi:hypothetical protein